MSEPGAARTAPALTGHWRSDMADASPAPLDGETALIELSNGKGFALIDADDLPLVSGRNWYLREASTHAGYAIADRGVSMHRLITGAQPGWHVDHINHNGLDNRRSNLRVVSAADNVHNQRGHTAATSRYKGVSWSRKGDRWQASIRDGDVTTYLGRFESEDDAAIAYDRAAFALWGDLAYLNLPDRFDDLIVRSQRKPSDNTHCKRGHEFTPENTIVTSTQRYCRTCKNAAQARYNRKRRGASDGR